VFGDVVKFKYTCANQQNTVKGRLVEKHKTFIDLEMEETKKTKKRNKKQTRQKNTKHLSFDNVSITGFKITKRAKRRHPTKYTVTKPFDDFSKLVEDNVVQLVLKDGATLRGTVRLGLVLSFTSAFVFVFVFQFKSTTGTHLELNLYTFSSDEKDSEMEYIVSRYKLGDIKEVRCLDVYTGDSATDDDFVVIFETSEEEEEEQTTTQRK